MSNSINRGLTKAAISHLGKHIAYVRIGFGIIWLLDAILKFNPSFYRGMLDIIRGADTGGPSWLDGWYNLWFGVIGLAPHLFAILVIVFECFIAFSLIFGFSRKISYVLGAVFSFLLWSVAEGFGHFYDSGSTDPGAAIIYVVVFILLYVIDGHIPAQLSIDTFLEKHI